MLKRILTGLVGIPVVLFVIYIGGTYFFAFVFLLAMLGVHEGGNLLRAKDIPVSVIIYCFPILYFGVLYTGREHMASQVVAALVLGLLTRQLFGFPHFGLTAVGGNVLAAVYPTVLLGNVLLLRLHAGLSWTVATIVGIWAYDTFAYFVGVRFGKVHPWPGISPKKSREGTVGGFIGSILVIVLARGHLGITSLPVAVLLGLLVGGVGQLGDLAESALKRYVGVKDSGTLLPGHGGVLDRFDSLMFAATIVYWIWSLTIIR